MLVRQTHALGTLYVVMTTLKETGMECNQAHLGITFKGVFEDENFI